MSNLPATASNQSTITLTRSQLADIAYSAAVQGRESTFDQHRAMPVGTVLNRIAEGIADSVISNPAQWQGPSLRDALWDAS